MRRAGWWILALLGVVLALIAMAAVFWVAGPVASNLWLLLGGAVALGVGVAALAGRLLAARLGLTRGTGALVLAVVAALFPAGLAAWVGTSALPSLEAPSPDPRGPHETIRLSTGSTIALWRQAADGVPARATPVVFLHGGPGFYAHPREFAKGAAFRRAGFATLFYDQPGSGASGDLAVADYTVARQVADLEALRVHLGAEQLVVWGQSWGASLGAYYARAYPSRVAAVIAESPGEYPGQPLLDFDKSRTNAQGEFVPPPRMAVLYVLLTRAPQLAEQYMLQAEHHGFNNAAWVANRSVAGIRCKGEVDPPRALVSNSGLPPLVRIMASRDAMVVPLGKPLAIPALVLRGACDYIPAAAARAHVAGHVDAELVEVPGTGHMLPDRDDAFDAAVARFAATRLAGVR